MLLELAILKNFDPDTYKAGVQLAGSLTTYFDDVPVSRAIPTSALVIGNRVILAIPGDNPKDACVIATWPQGSAGGAEVHGNEYHDPDFEQQGVAASLIEIHRTSEVHNQPQPPTSHASTHDLLSTDRIKIMLNVFNATFVIFDWSCRDAWTDYVTGSGSVVWSAPLMMVCSTGTTLDSIGALYPGVAASLSPHNSGHPFAARFQAASILLDSELWITARRTGVSPTSFPSLTEQHVGWRILNGRIYASNGNGTNGTQTDTGVDIAQWGTVDLLILGSGAGVDANFYVNRSLKATHTTNLPPQWSYRCWLGIKNAAAADKSVWIQKVAWAEKEG
jgi:hypothetical protein